MWCLAVVAARNKHRQDGNGMPWAKLVSVPSAGITRSKAAEASVSKKSPGERLDLAMSYVRILFNVGAMVDRKGLHPC